MHRIITMLALAALALLGFAAPAASATEDIELAERQARPSFELPKPIAVDEECTGPGESSEGGIELPSVMFWNYDIIGPGDGDNEDGQFHPLAPDTYTVKAEFDFGDFDTLSIQKFPKVHEWELTVKDAGDCKIEVTPEGPTFTHPTCGAGEIVPGESVIPEQTGVVYTPAEGGEINHGDEVEVSAEPAEGYFFPEDVTDYWDFLGVRPGCDGQDGSDGEDGKDGETPPPATSDKTCDDFSNTAAAIAHVASFPGDLDRLDGDDDGVPCESLNDTTPVANTADSLPKTGAGYGTLALLGLGLALIGSTMAISPMRRRVGKLFNR